MPIKAAALLNLSTADDDGIVVAYDPGAAADLKITGALSDYDADGVAASQTPAAGGTQSLTLNGVTASGGTAWIKSYLGTARRVTIAGTGNESGLTFVISGINSAGNAVTENVTGPNNSVVVSTGTFEKVTGITVSGNTAAAITVGFEGIATLDSNGNARRVRLTTAADETSRTVTVYGKNKFGTAIQETITLVNSTTVDSVYDYKTVTRISISGDPTSTIKAGTGPIASTPWLPLDLYNGANVALACILSSGASLTYRVEHTFHDIQSSHEVPAIEVFPHEDLVSKTASDDGNYLFCPRAIRATLEAFSSGTLTLAVNQGMR